MSSFNSPTPNFDNLLLQTLMGRLQVRPPPPPVDDPNFQLQSLEEALLNNLLLSDSDSDDDEFGSSSKSQLAKEESKLEKDIIRTIRSGKTDDLKPNSGQAVTIGEHHICVGFHEDTDSDYRVWEWHGHIMLFDEENGYTPEYIYGNHFERVNRKDTKDNKQQEKYAKSVADRDDSDDDESGDEKKVATLGLRELIDSKESSNGRILHRNINAGSRFQ
ncbi:OLC1v1034775C1 [Oldenlandia corymbosa var. corymbosa]|uniref:OLC1v1034775C1 n=1 Tax=Oldenlandia corymbosa var. corymbosa TaxID=529605 RepID=A0AAV1CRF2_OLDCO|nr:OLC1v1034775C1 [Oldenlandia corymbosa var. corymbosa]